MATYSFEALRFDPAPGDADAVEEIARDCARVGQDLNEDAAQLAGLGDHSVWEGDAAQAFEDRCHQVLVDLGTSRAACERLGSTLIAYAEALRDAQTRARQAEQEAADARAEAQRAASEIERLSSAAPTIGAADVFVGQVQAAHQQQAKAEDDYQAALQRARAIHDWVQDAGDAAAHTIRGIKAPYHKPHRSLFRRAVGGVADAVGGVASAVDDFVDEHADLLRGISGALKTVSAAAGLLSFVPVLTPIMAPIATATAVSALALDATLVASGHGSWQQVAVDGALMALPGAGRLASRAVMGRQAERLVVSHLDEVAALNLPNRTRPGTVAALKTRDVKLNAFKGMSKAPRVELHPHLERALDRIPVVERSLFHGKCAEINAIDNALKDGARLKDSVLQTRRLRRVGDPLHGSPHLPCDSCRAVLRDLKIKYTE